MYKRQHESCSKARDGQFLVTSTSYEIEYYYEMVIGDNSYPSFVTSELDIALQKSLAATLVDCSLGEDSDIQGISTVGGDLIAGNCQSQLLDMADDATLQCLRMKGTATVYMHEDSDLTENEIETLVWDTLRADMNEDDDSSRRKTRKLSSIVDALSLIHI